MLGESAETSHQIMVDGIRYYLPINAPLGITWFQMINPNAGIDIYGSPLRLALKANGYKLNWISAIGFNDFIQITRR